MRRGPRLHFGLVSVPPDHRNLQGGKMPRHFTASVPPPQLSSKLFFPRMSKGQKGRRNASGRRIWRHPTGGRRWSHFAEAGSL